MGHGTKKRSVTSGVCGAKGRFCLYEDGRYWIMSLYRQEGLRREERAEAGVVLR